MHDAALQGRTSAKTWRNVRGGHAKGRIGDSPTSHSRSYQLQMLTPCRQQAASGGQNVIGGLLTLTPFWLVLGLSVYPVSEIYPIENTSERVLV